MILIIDGYNLLHILLNTKKKITDRERNQYIAVLGNYARIRHHDIVLVFDGGMYAYPAQEKHGLVSVVFTGNSMTADEYIIKSLRQKSAEITLIISSDSALTDKAAEGGYVSISSQLFRPFLQNVLVAVKEPVKDTLIYKWSSTENPEVDDLMIQYSTRAEEKLELESEPSIKQTNEKHAKHERKLINILKKL